MAGPAHQAPGAPSQALRERYAEAFRAWLEHRDERELGTAYALGREAVHAQLSVLDLAEAHHEAAADAIRAEPDPARAAELISAASTFLGEALSTFEIAHRGYYEVQEVARLEHEHVEQRRAAARHARGRRRPRARVHPARRGDPRPARAGRLRGHRQDGGLHARAPH